MNEFEVIVSDNDPMQSSECFRQEFLYSNFSYYKTECEGFLNSFYSLSYGRGKFLKLHNNYTAFKHGSLRYLINEIKQYTETKPCVFFTNGYRHQKKKKQYDTLDSFMSDLSYFSSWSSGFGIWKEDYDIIKDKVSIDAMFPQTSMFTEILDKHEFILYDNVIFEDQKVPKKGGYNPYKVFGIKYLELINPLKEKGMITLETYERIRKELLYNYLASRFFKSAIIKMDNFAYDDVKKYLAVNYTTKEYYIMLMYSVFTPIRYVLDKLF